MEQHGTFQRFSGAAWLWLSDVGAILAGTVVSDSGGGGTSTWATATGTVACRVDPLGGGEGLVGGRISDRTTHVLTLSSEVPINEANRVVLDSGEEFVVTATRMQTGNSLQQIEVAHL